MRHGSLAVAFFLTFLAFAPPSLAAPTFEHPFLYTHRATTNGLWHDPAIWDSGLVPGEDAVVLIEPNVQVIVITEEVARLKLIQVEGELRMTISLDTRLFVETLYIAESGTFRIGDPVNTVAADKRAELVFIHDGQPIGSWDPMEKSRGLISDGKVAIYGHPKTSMVGMDQGTAIGQMSLNLLQPVPADWEIGDEIVLTGTHFRRGTESQEEKRTIANISGDILLLDAPLEYAHQRVRTDMNLHVANLTRNVILRSESTDIPLRGHIMLAHGDVDIRHAALLDLGRTDKSIPLDDFVVTVEGENYTVVPGTDIQNRRGRYSLHFHRNGIFPGQEPPSKVYGCVVVGTPGWAFVNHSSHVDFRNNVVYDFVGGAFVTEVGDELGNFFDNIAIRGTGDGDYRTTRLVFGNPNRPQPLSDFAFSGDGFWFQGPALRVRNNVANGCNGTGMIWFTAGAVNVDTDRYEGFPRSALASVYGERPDFAEMQPRNWIHDPDSLVISDLPILECDGFDGYGNLSGFRLRFNNFDNRAFYREGAFAYDTHIEQPHWEAQRIRQSISRLHLWNNEIGLRVRYNAKTDWSHVKNVNRLRFHPRTAFAGAEITFQLKDNTFDDLLISGYEVAGWIDFHNAVGTTSDNRDEIHFTNTTYDRFAQADTWHTDVPCDEVSGLSVTDLTSTGALLAWDPHPEAQRFLIRYKVNEPSHPRWILLPQGAPEVTSKPLTNLQPGTEYIFQVMAGCSLSVSRWSPDGNTFTTTP